MWKLKRLMTEIKVEADKCGFDIRLIGELLKFTPKKVYTHLMLELEEVNKEVYTQLDEQPSFQNYIVIYQHRNSELTTKYKGKTVSKKWVLGFLQTHAIEAKKISENYDPPPKREIVDYSKIAVRAYIHREVCNACGKPIDFCICGR